VNTPLPPDLILESLFIVAKICGTCSGFFVAIVRPTATVLTSVHGKAVNYGQTIQLRHVRSVAAAPM
jgi:hypothetical protein